MSTSDSKNPTWLQLMLRRDIFLRSIKVALLVGTILALINHGDRIFAASVSPDVALKIALTYLVPFSVSLWASVQTALSQHSH